DLFRLGLAEEAGRAEQQDEHHHHEGDGVAVAGELAAADEGFDHADEQAADDRAGDVADAAQHRGGERFDAGHDAHERVDLRVGQAVEDAGHGGQHRADDEGHGDDAVGGDPHQRSRLEVERHGAHGPAELRPVDDVLQHHHEDERHHQDDELV